MQSLDTLLLDGLQGGKPHLRPAGSFADARGIIHIIFLALHIGPDKLGTHELRRVAKLGKLAGPVLGPSRGFHANEAGRQLRHKGQDLRPRQAFGENHVPALIHAAQPKHMLCHINTQCCNLPCGPSPFM